MSKRSSHVFKILTCCYCGARSTLAGSRSGRLVCHGCGAPAENLEKIQCVLEKRRKKSDHPKAAVPHPAERAGAHLDKDRPARRKKGKRKKRSVWYHVAEALDDWDDIFDFFD